MRLAELWSGVAAIVGFLHATVFAVLALFLGTMGELTTPTDWVPVCYALVLGALAFGTYRRSRVAVASLLALALWLEGGLWWRNGGGFQFLLALTSLFYAAGLWGTILWHRVTASGAPPSTVTPAA